MARLKYMPRIIREWSALRGENNTMTMIVPIVIAIVFLAAIYYWVLRACDIYVEFNKSDVGFVNKERTWNENTMMNIASLNCIYL